MKDFNLISIENEVLYKHTCMKENEVSYIDFYFDDGEFNIEINSDNRNDDRLYIGTIKMRKEYDASEYSMQAIISFIIDCLYTIYRDKYISDEVENKIGVFASKARHDKIQSVVPELISALL